jgi:hypothetical protein
MFAKKCFAFWYLFCKFGLCCRSREYKEQQKFIDKAGDEVDRQTDLLRLIKQKNMAAKTIWVLASKPIRELLAESNTKKIVDLEEESEDEMFENEWLENMDFTTKERDLMVSFIDKQG